MLAIYSHTSAGVIIHRNNVKRIVGVGYNSPLLHPLPTPGSCQCPLACGHIPPVSASMVSLSPFLLCLFVSDLLLSPSYKDPCGRI